MPHAPEPGAQPAPPVDACAVAAATANALVASAAAGAAAGAAGEAPWATAQGGAAAAIIAASHAGGAAVAASCEAAVDEAEVDKAELAREIEAKLPKRTRDIMDRLVADGIFRKHDFDASALANLRGLNPNQQEKVLDHIEEDRVVFLHSRSKSGFLYAMCDRARNGSLDVRGIGAPDPWRPFLLAMATPRRQTIELVPEAEWLERLGGPRPMRLLINASADALLGRHAPELRLAVAPDRLVAELKAMLAAVGAGMPRNRMKLTEPSNNMHLRDDRTLAFYNLRPGSALVLSERVRGGAAVRQKRLSSALQDA